MSKITITRADSDYDITADGCVVTPDTGTAHSITWEQMEDVEYLSNVFADYTVRMFKDIVKTLGLIYNNRAAYKDIV